MTVDGVNRKVHKTVSNTAKDDDTSHRSHESMTASCQSLVLCMACQSSLKYRTGKWFAQTIYSLKALIFCCHHPATPPQVPMQAPIGAASKHPLFAAKICWKPWANARQTLFKAQVHGSHLGPAHMPVALAPHGVNVSPPPPLLSVHARLECGAGHERPVYHPLGHQSRPPVYT